MHYAFYFCVTKNCTGFLMKSLLHISLFLAYACAWAQPTIKIPKFAHDFGTIDEGTQASFEEVLQKDSKKYNESKVLDIEEIENCKKALEYGIAELKNKQNMFVPGTGFEVVTRDFLYDEQPENLIVLAHNFKDYIINNTNVYILMILLKIIIKKNYYFIQ